MDKRYQVFISSTFNDLKEERKAIIESLLNAKYIPAGMETFSASNDEQFKYIKKIIDTCDYYVLIVGARYGSINSSTGKSFTEQEYDYAVEKGIPVLVFLHADPYNLPVGKREDDKRELLEKFRKKVSEGRLCKLWHTPSELIASVIISLGEEVANNPQSGWIRGNEKAETIINSSIRYRKMKFCVKLKKEIDDSFIKEQVKSAMFKFNDLFTEKIFMDILIEGKNIVAELNCPEYIKTDELLRYLVQEFQRSYDIGRDGIESANMF